MEDIDKNKKFISLQEATKFCGYTQEYLSLRARQGKLKAKKIGRNWQTTEDWLEDYLKRVEVFKNVLVSTREIKDGKILTFEEKKENKQTTEPEHFFTLPTQPGTKARHFAFALVLTFFILGAGVVFGYPYFNDGIKKIGGEIKDSVAGLSKNVEDASEDFLKTTEEFSLSVFSSAKKVKNYIRDDKKFVGKSFSLISKGTKEWVEKILDATGNFFDKLANLPKEKGENIAEGSSGVSVFLRHQLWQAKEKLSRLPSAFKTYSRVVFYYFSKAYNFVVRPWKLGIPEGEFTQLVKREDFEILKSELERIKTEGVISKELVKEIQRITQIIPIKEITKQFTKIDSEELSLLKADLATIKSWESDIDNLRIITSKLQAGPANTQIINSPIYIGSQGLEVNGVGNFTSLAVSGSAGITNLGVGKSATIGSNGSDQMVVNANADFRDGVTFYNGFTSNGNSSFEEDLTVDGNLNVAGNTSLVGTLAVSSTSTLTTTTITQLAVGTTTPSGIFSIATSTGASVLFVGEDGNVGIGTTTPGYALHVIGDGRFTGDIYAGGNLNIVGTTTHSGHVIPADDNTYDIGSLEKRFRNINSGPSGLSIYNSNTSSTDYELGSLNFSSNILTLSASATGTGSVRPIQIKTDSNIGIYLATDGNVGIGTTTPNNFLQIVGTTTARHILPETTNSYDLGSLLLAWNNVYSNNLFATSSTLINSIITDSTTTNATTTNLYVSNSVFLPNGSLQTTDIPLALGNVLVGNSSNYAEATSSLYVQTDGNVGIGTASPTTNLTIGGSNPAINLFRSDGVAGPSIGMLTVSFPTSGFFGNANSGWGVTSGNQLYTATPAVGRNVYMGLGNQAQIAITANLDQDDITMKRNVGATTAKTSGGALLHLVIDNTDADVTHTDNFLEWSNDGINALGVISSSGNVGIGTTSPSTMLSIQGTSSTTDLFRIASSTRATLLTVDTGGRLGIGSSTPTAFLSILQNNTTPYINIASSTATAFYIDSLGNVGIGTQSPTAALHVSPVSGYAGNLLTIASSTATAGTGMVVLNDGNVGIGTVAPTHRLDVVAVATAGLDIKTTGATSYSRLSFGSNANVIYGFNSSYSTNGRYVASSLLVDSNAQLGLAANNSYPIVFYLNNVEKMRINTTGNVGIGTSTPLGILSVASSTINGASYLFVGADGKVGIGTATPGQELEISKAPAANAFIGTKIIDTGTSGGNIKVGIIRNSSGTVGYGGIWLNQTTPTTDNFSFLEAGYSIFNSPATQMSFRVAGINRMVLFTSGGLSLGSTYYLTDPGVNNMIIQNKVGVGTTTPSAMLTVQGVASSTDLFRIASSTMATLLAVDTDGRLGIGSSTPQSLLSISRNGSVIPFLNIASSTATAFYIGANGKVGIGTASPTAKLDVDGNINISTTAFDSTKGVITKNGTRFIHDYGNNNVFVGYGAGSFTASSTSYYGTKNVAVGVEALSSLTDGYYNVAIGYRALKSLTTGTYNTAVGYLALTNITDGTNNSAFGPSALNSLTSGSRNVAFGGVLNDLQTGSDNVAFGNSTLYSIVSTSNNTAFGNYVLGTATGGSNTAAGYTAMQKITTGNNNTAFGMGAGRGATGAAFSNNSFFGYNSGNVLTTGSNNILIGYQAGDALTTGSNNIIIGYDIDLPATTSANMLDIGNLIYATGLSGAGLVGIGTTSPSAVLTIQGTSSTTDLFRIASSTRATLLTVDTSGNVGIGTSTPNAKLSLSKTAGSITPVLYISSTTQGDLMTITSDALTERIGFGTVAPESIGTGKTVFDVRGTSGAGMIFGSASVRSYFTNTGGATDIGSWNDIPIVFSYYNTEKVRITNNGWFGIGTTTPNAFMTIRGTSTTTPYMNIASTTATAFYIGADGKVGIGTAAPSSGLTLSGKTLEFSSEGESGYEIKYTGTSAFNIYNIGSASANALHLGTSNTPRISISYDGNVGIGTTSPAQKLNIYQNDSAVLPMLNIEQDGDGDAALKFMLTGTAAWSMGVDNSDSDKFKIGISGTDLNSNNLFTIQQNGNVGIGTTTPNGVLSVFASGTQPYLNVASSTGTALYVSSAGNMGIGTSTPMALLDLFKADNDATINLTASSTSVSSWTMGIDISDGGKFKIASSTALGTDDRLTINTSGNVGIGTTSPAAKLHVYGGGSAPTFTITGGDGSAAAQRIQNYANTSLTSSYLYFQRAKGTMAVPDTVIDGNSLGNIEFQGYSTIGASFYGVAKIAGYVDGEFNTGGDVTDYPGRLTFFTTPEGDWESVERMRITSTGNVGIGITTSSYVRAKLGVWGTAGPYDIVDFASSTGATVFRIDNNGRTGIGTSLPTAQLSVQGIASSTNILTVASSTGTTLITVNPSGYLGIGDSTPDYPLEILSTTAPQLMLSYADGVNYAGLSVDSNGYLTLDPSGNIVSVGGSSDTHDHEFRTYGYDSASTTNRYAYLTHTGSDILLDPSFGTGWIRFGNEATDLTGGVLLFGNSSAGENREFRVYGYNTASAASSYGSLKYSDDYDALLLNTNVGHVQIGSAGTLNRITSPTSSDLFVSGRLEVDGMSYFDGTLSSYVTTTLALTSGNVGIGTSTPAAKLDVFGGLRISSQAGNTAHIKLIPWSVGDSAVYTALNSGGAGTLLSAPTITEETGPPFHLYYNDGTQTSVLDAWKNSAAVAVTFGNFFTMGNIGIGTTSPAALLSVQAISSSSDIFIIASSTGQTLLSVNNAGRVGIGTSSPIASLNVNGDIYFWGGTGDLNDNGFVNASDLIDLTNYFRNTASGTETQLARADTNGDGKVSLDDYYSLSFLNGVEPTTTPGDFTYKKYEIKRKVGLLYGVGNNTFTQFNVNGSFFVGTSTAASAFVQTVFLVDSPNKRVGIGTSSPIDTLSIFASGTQPFLNIASSTATAFYIGADGNVGIGTTSLNNKLTVLGGDIVLRETDDGQVAVNLHSSASGGSISVYEGGGTKILFSGWSGTNSYFNSGGNIGIGTSTPNANLSLSKVAGSITPVLYISSTTQGDLMTITSDALTERIGFGTVAPESIGAGKTVFDVRGTNGAGMIFGSASVRSYFTNTGGATDIGSWNDIPIVFSYNSVEKVRITNNGWFGIGTTTPNAFLTIKGDATTTPYVNIASTTATAFYVGADGKVGIGTAAPVQKLDINGSARILGSGSDTYGSANYFEVGNVSNNQAGFQINAAGGLGFWNDGTGAWTQRMVITNGGNVGIGTTSPTGILSVASSTINGASYLFVGANGNVGIGTSSPTAKLEIGGNFYASTTNGGFYIIGLGVADATALHISATGLVTKSTSSRKYKTDIQKFDFDSQKIMELNPVTFKWNEMTVNPGKESFGLIAEDVYEIFPELVGIGADGLPESVDYARLSVILLKVMQEQQKKLDELLVSQNSSGTIINLSAEELKSGLANLGIVITETGMIEVGDLKIKNGLTLYDKITNEPYCVSIENGEIKTTVGECIVQNHPVIQPGAPSDDGANSNAQSSTSTSTSTGECIKKSFFYDSDKDGFGHGGNFQEACEASSTQWVLSDNDCNDSEPAIYPGAKEICDNGKDNDCDGTEDKYEDSCKISEATTTDETIVETTTTIETIIEGTTTPVE